MKLEEILVAYKIGKINLEEAVLVLKEQPTPSKGCHSPMCDGSCKPKSLSKCKHEGCENELESKDHCKEHRVKVLKPKTPASCEHEFPTDVREDLLKCVKCGYKIKEKTPAKKEYIDLPLKKDVKARLHAPKCPCNMCKPKKPKAKPPFPFKGCDSGHAKNCKCLMCKPPKK